MYDIEKYYEARSVEEAVRLLNEHPEARIISGGSDVLTKPERENLQVPLW